MGLPVPEAQTGDRPAPGDLLVPRDPDRPPTAYVWGSAMTFRFVAGTFLEHVGKGWGCYVVMTTRGKAFVDIQPCRVASVATQPPASGSPPPGHLTVGTGGKT